MSLQAFFLSELERARIKKKGASLTDDEYEAVRRTTAEMHSLGLGPHNLRVTGPVGGPYSVGCDCEGGGQCVHVRTYVAGLRRGLDDGTAAAAAQIQKQLDDAAAAKPTGATAAVAPVTFAPGAIQVHVDQHEAKTVRTSLEYDQDGNPIRKIEVREP